MQEKYNISVYRNAIFTRAMRLKVMTVTWLLVTIAFIVWAESGADDQTHVMERGSSGSHQFIGAPLQEQLAQELAGFKEMMKVHADALERNRSALTSLSDVIDANTRHLNSVEARLTKVNEDKEKEINRLNAALGAAITEAESADKSTQKLESWLRQSIVEKQNKIDKLETLVKETEEELKVLQLSRQDSEYRLSQVSAECTMRSILAYQRHAYLQWRENWGGRWDSNPTT